MFGDVGSISDNIFSMGTQNGSRLENGSAGFLIHTLELKLWPCFPYVCTGKPCVCNVSRPRVT